MPRDVASLVALARSDGAAKFFKYTAVSVVSVVISELTLVTALQFVEATWANVIAVSVGTVPSYQLNRRWAWGKTGKGHLWREVMPFWIMSFIGLAVSTIAVYLLEQNVVADQEHLTGKEKALVALTNLGAFALLWVAKFLIINKVLFHHTPPDEIDPVLDGRSGFPT